MQQAKNTQAVSQQILFMTDVERMIGRNRVTLRRWWMAGKFPIPVKLNGTTLVWPAHAINAWIERNIG